MEWKLQQSECGGSQLIIIQKQGDNTPTIFRLPYDATGYDFNGTVALPVPVILAVDSGITINNIMSCTGFISNTTLDITAVSTGTVYLGMTINGIGILPGTYITGFLTGIGGIGTYSVNLNQTAASTTIVETKLSLQLTSAQTQTVPDGQYVFDIWSTTPDIVPINSLILTGFFEINGALTVIS